MFQINILIGLLLIIFVLFCFTVSRTNRNVTHCWHRSFWIMFVTNGIRRVWLVWAAVITGNENRLIIDKTLVNNTVRSNFIPCVPICARYIIITCILNIVSLNNKKYIKTYLIIYYKFYKTIFRHLFNIYFPNNITIIIIF